MVVLCSLIVTKLRYCFLCSGLPCWKRDGVCRVLASPSGEVALLHGRHFKQTVPTLRRIAHGAFIFLKTGNCVMPGVFEMFGWKLVSVSGMPHDVHSGRGMPICSRCLAADDELILVRLDFFCVFQQHARSLCFPSPANAATIPAKANRICAGVLPLLARFSIQVNSINKLGDPASLAPLCVVQATGRSSSYG